MTVQRDTYRVCIRSVTSLLIDVIVPLLSSLDPTFPIPQNTLNLAHIPYSLPQQGIHYHTIILTLTVISIYFTLLSTLKTPTSPILTTLQTPSCIAHIPCASRALRLPRKFKIRLHLHRQLSQVDFLERLVLVSFRFFSFSIL